MTRHYAPDIIGHTANIERLRPSVRGMLKLLWTANENSLLGHRRAQDQYLEATMNCSVKNDVKVFTPANVITRAATVQMREIASNNLKGELFIPHGASASSPKKLT